MPWREDARSSATKARRVEFAEDVRQLKELIKPGPTTTSRCGWCRGRGRPIYHYPINQHTRHKNGGRGHRQCHPADGIAQTAKVDACRNQESAASGSDSGCSNAGHVDDRGGGVEVVCAIVKNAVTTPDAAPVSPAPPGAGSGVAVDLSSAGAAGPGTAVQPAPPPLPLRIVARARAVLRRPIPRSKS